MCLCSYYKLLSWFQSPDLCLQTFYPSITSLQRFVPSHLRMRFCPSFQHSAYIPWSVFPRIPFSFHIPIFHHPMRLLSSHVHTSMYMSLSQLFFNSLHSIGVFSLFFVFHFLTRYPHNFYLLLCIYCYHSPLLFSKYSIHLVNLVHVLFYSTNYPVSFYFAVSMLLLTNLSRPFPTIIACI
jgi:hypothetical protein